MKKLMLGVLSGLLLTAGAERDGLLIVWDMATGAQVARPRRERPPRDGGAGAWRRSGL
jgi:hypothetical protein